MSSHIYLALSSYLIVCAHVQHDGQTLLGRHASTCCVEGQLAHWDAHAMAAQVPQPQDPLSICHTHRLSINITVSLKVHQSHPPPHQSKSVCNSAAGNFCIIFHATQYNENINEAVFQPPWKIFFTKTSPPHYQETCFFPLCEPGPLLHPLALYTLLALLIKQ